MRMTIFRGKSYDGQWLMGSLVQIPNDDYEFDTYIYEPSRFSVGAQLNPRKVYEDSVGQATGTSDIDGDIIFEGDIIEVGAYSKAPLGCDKAVVFWNYYGWSAVFENGDVVDMDVHLALSSKVVGNVFDDIKTVPWYADWRRRTGG